MQNPATWLLWFIGNRIFASAVMIFIGGICVLIFGMAPMDLAAAATASAPWWFDTWWFRFLVIVVGLGLIFFAINLNLMSAKQSAVDRLSRLLSDAIHDPFNRPVTSDAEALAAWNDYLAWNARVLAILNWRFFTETDRIHFDRLGAFPVIRFGHLYNDAQQNHARMLNQMAIKFDRLREITRHYNRR